MRSWQRASRQPVACMTTAAPAAAPKAALVVIGNEVLSGSITDTNTPWLAKLLYRCDACHMQANCHTRCIDHTAA
jgi:hypothetical protein